MARYKLIDWLIVCKNRKTAEKLLVWIFIMVNPRFWWYLSVTFNLERCYVFSVEKATGQILLQLYVVMYVLHTCCVHPISQIKVVIFDLHWVPTHPWKSLKVLESFILNLRPWKSLKTGQVLESPWIHRVKLCDISNFVKHVFCLKQDLLIIVMFCLYQLKLSHNHWNRY